MKFYLLELLQYLIIYRCSLSTKNFITNLLVLVLQDPVIKTIASRIGCTPAQVCIAFALAKGLAVVTKTEKETRMKENLDSIEVAKKLTAEDIQIIDTLNKNLRKFWDVYAIP